MSVWKSDEKLLSICILNFSIKNDFVWEENNIKHSTQCFITRWNTSKFVKNTPLRVVFVNSLLGVSSGDETLRLMFDILLLCLFVCFFSVTTTVHHIVPVINGRLKKTSFTCVSQTGDKTQTKGNTNTTTTTTTWNFKALWHVSFVWFS